MLLVPLLTWMEKNEIRTGVAEYATEVPGNTDVAVPEVVPTMFRFAVISS
jgi:hypothetical protein